MKRSVIHTDQAPGAVGPYSQAIRVNGMVYTSGQIGLDPTNGKMVTGGVEAEAEQSLANLKAVLEAAGASMESVVKTTVFITDMADFAAINVIYSRFFGDSRPARSCVAAAQLPLGALFEIECVAMIED